MYTLLESGPMLSPEELEDKRRALRLRADASAISEPPGKQLQQLSPVSTQLISDFSERIALEEEKAKLELKLQKAKKLETLGATRQGDSTTFFAAIEKASLRAADLTSQLLAYAGKGRWQVARVDLGEVVRDLAKDLAGALPENLTLHCRGTDPPPFVKGDRAQVSQVLRILAMNAFEAFPDGRKGEITIQVASVEMAASPALPGGWILPVLPGANGTVEVSDTGEGMAKGILERAFEPFFTTKFAGRGLGLAAVVGILGAHGGGLEARSEPGRGSAFRFYLPVAAASQARSA